MIFRLTAVIFNVTRNSGQLEYIEKKNKKQKPKDVGHFFV